MMQTQVEEKITKKGRKSFRKKGLDGKKANKHKDFKKKSKKLTDFDKYYYYLKSVQSPETDVEFLRDVYIELKGTRGKTLREDFCGTFKILCEWVKLHKEYQGFGVDLDEEPTEYGKRNYLSQLKEEQQKKIKIINENVLNSGLPQADIIAGMNFSYFIFKTREVMKQYFTNCLKDLKKNGILVLDCFGGSACMSPNEEETVHKDKGFSYFWDQDSYDNITNHVQFHIHFKRKGEKKRKKVFSYDWRMWSIPELRDILEEVGFKKSHVYWEGTDKDGEGDGNFKRTEVSNEDCEAWVAYIVAEK